MIDSVALTVSPRGIAALTLNRPDRSNAFDQPMLNELARQMVERADDHATRVVVLRGAGRHFCGGADLAARAADGEQSTAQASLTDVLMALENLPKPTVAVVHGAAVGGGAGFAACCDIVLAAESAFFSIPEVRVGMAPLGVAAFLINAMGQRAFGRYAQTGERFSANEALRIGLVHEVVNEEKLDERLAEIADALLHGAPGALRELKTAMKSRFSPPRMEAPHAPGPRSAEALEGIASFKEKRKPSWYPQ
jgi:methylglutaconyl-CoA hydratase